MVVVFATGGGTDDGGTVVRGTVVRGTTVEVVLDDEVVVV